MSFGASGQLGGAIVFASWKGVNTARQYVKPANPRTPGQIAQRDLMALIVSIWRNPALASVIKAAWNRLAAAATNAVSGFNLFTSNLVKLAAQDPDASVVVDVTGTGADAVTFSMKNLDDLAAGDEAGNFGIVYGPSPSQMVNGVSQPIVAGEIAVDVSALFEAADVVYFSIRKAGTEADVFERSGIVEVTLT